MKVREIVDLDTLIIIYQSIIQPYFVCCAQVRGSLGKTLAAKVQKLQNRAFRIITRENTIVTRTPDEYIRVHTSNIRVHTSTYEKQTSNIRVNTSTYG